MKKLYFFVLMIFIICLFSCGASEEDRKKVCECEKLNETMKNEANELRIAGHPIEEANDHSMDNHKSEFDNCQKLHESLGDDSYFQLTQKCVK